MVGYAPRPGILDLLMVMECSIKVSEEDDSLLDEEPLLTDEEELSDDEPDEESSEEVVESITDDSLESDDGEEDESWLQPVRALMDRRMPRNRRCLRMKDSFLTIIFQRQRDMIA